MASVFAALGRVLLGSYFLITGAMIVLAPEAAGALFVGAGMAPQGATVAGVFECMAGLCLALGMATRVAAAVLATWTVLAFILFNSWVAPGDHVHEVLMHLGVIGGLLVVASQREARWSLDTARYRARALRADAQRRTDEAGALPRRDRENEMGHPVSAK